MTRWPRQAPTVSAVPLKFHALSSAVDSEKSLSPLAEESRPFTVPFRPYDWSSSYPAPVLRPQLVQQSLHPGMELDRGPVAMPFYGDGSSNHSALYTDRTLAEEFGDYRRHGASAALRFPDRGLHANGHGVKARSELLCSSLMLNGAYKCVKCSKVRMGSQIY